MKSLVCGRLNDINILGSVYMLLVTVVFVSFVLFAASGLRGTDQYWYVADVDTLLQGEPSTTNNVFPAQLMSDNSCSSPPFIHNILNLYLVLPLAMVLGSYGGWIITNIIATILTAVLIALILKKLVKGWIAILAYTIYLLLPLTVWQTAQPLAEATITCFVALGILIYIKADRNPFLWALLLVVTCLAYYCRATFLPILVVIPVAYLVHSKPYNVKTILVTASFFCLIVVVLLTKGMIFPQMTLSLRELINTGLPGQSNMSGYFAISPSPIVLSSLFSKVVSNLAAQVLPSPWFLQIFYLPFNVLAGLSVYLVFSRKTDSEFRIAQCGGILVLLHLATVLIYQNQFRYLMTTLPAVLICGALVIDRIDVLQSKQVQAALLLGIFISLAVANTPIATQSHHEGLKERELVTTLKSLFDDTVPKSDSLMVEGIEKYLMLGYVLRPRTTAFVEPGYDHEDYQIMRERVNAKWLLCPETSPLVEFFDIALPLVRSDLPEPWIEYGLFRL